MSAEARFLFVRLVGIALGVPMVFVIVTFGVDSISNRPDPAGDLASMRYVMVGLIVLLSAGQYWYERRDTDEAQKMDGRGRQEDE
jgi:membrane protein DedA with SNARE-associated domain